MEYKVAPPMPIHREIDSKIEKIGTAILTPANASGPTPLLTKIPSTNMLIAMRSIPIIEGIKYDINSFFVGVFLNVSFIFFT